MDKQNVAYPYHGIYAALKRDEALTQATTWMDLEDIMLSEGSRHRRPHIVGFYLYETFRIGKAIETESRFVVALAWGPGKSAADGAWGFF